MLDQYLPVVSLPTLIFGGSLALILLLYVISKLVYVERGIFPLALKGINRSFEAIFGELKYFGGFLFGYTKEELDDFLANENLLKGMSNTITGVAIVLVIFSFLASYSASRDFVITRGISPNIAFAIPLGIDGFIVLLILFISYQSLKGEGTIFGRVFLLVFTAMSIYFNISHLEANSGLWTLAHVTAGAIAPAIVFIGMEVVSSVQKAQVLRSGLVRTDAELREQLEGLRQELGQSQMKVDAHKGIIAGIDQTMKEYREREAEVQTSIAHMEYVLKQLDEAFFETLGSEASSRLDKVVSLVEAGLDEHEIANRMNVKLETIKTYLRQAESSGMLNGAV